MIDIRLWVVKIADVQRCVVFFLFVGWGQRRGWQQSVIELLSPLLMMTLLVWAWSRSTEDHFKAQIYANASLPILSILRQDLLSNSKSLLQLCPADMLAHQVSKHVVYLVSSFVVFVNEFQIIFQTFVTMWDLVVLHTTPSLLVSRVFAWR